MTKDADLEAIATAFRKSAYNAYCNTLIGGPQQVAKAYERMSNPKVGDWVIETTTIRRFRHAGHSDLDGIGILEEIAWEKVSFGNDPDFVWDEGVEGKPHPTEKIYYVRTMDGRRFRWENAIIIAVLTELFP